MRQLGDPPELDVHMTEIVFEALQCEGFEIVDAEASTAAKDYLARIFELIRATGFTVAIFSEQTRGTAMANISLELGFAAMSGKPLLIVKSKAASAPSDLKRTDWIEYSPGDESGFRSKLAQAAEELRKLDEWEQQLLDVALEARTMDCAVAFERAQKAFLLSGDERCVAAADAILEKLECVSEDEAISDLERLRFEIRTFRRQARSANERQ